MPKSVEPPILPIVEKDDGWYIDATELYGEDDADYYFWGPYDTKAEANDDRSRQFVNEVRAKRRVSKNRKHDKRNPA